MKVMYGTKLYAGGFEYKINEMNCVDSCNPMAKNPKISVVLIF